MNMNTFFYMAMATDVDNYEQSDYLYLVKHNGKIVGCSSEFEMCTFDIDLASSKTNFAKAVWFSWREVNLNIPASIEELRHANLLHFVIGYRRRWHSREPVIPFE